MKIALIGKMRSGKDTVGEYLINNYAYKRFAFGDGIGEIIEKYFPEAFEQGKPRHHYQFIGQSMRELDIDVWVKYLLKKVHTYEKYYMECFKYMPNVVVTDTRQVNEVDKLRADGFKVVKVVCPDEIRLERMNRNGDVFTQKDLEHDTEKQVDLCTPDYIIVNDGELADLFDKVSLLIKEVGIN